MLQQNIKLMKLFRAHFDTYFDVYAEFNHKGSEGKAHEEKQSAPVNVNGKSLS